LEDFLNRITEPLPGTDFPIFETKQKALMFAASLGFARKTRIPVENRGVGIRFEVFQTDMDDAYLDAIAVAEKGDLRILAAEHYGERIQVFEEYAHAGLLEMNRVCFDIPGDPLESLIRLVADHRAGENTEIPGIDPDVLKALVS
jgi:dnd system-associated protein 4